MASACTAVWERAVPPSVSPKRGDSVPPRVSLATLELPPRHLLPEHVSLSASQSTRGPFKSISLSYNLPWRLSQPEVAGTSLSGSGALGWGPSVGLGLLSPQEGSLQLRHPSWFLPATCRCLLQFYLVIITKIIQTSCFVTKKDLFGKKKGCNPARADTTSHVHSLA